MRRDQYVDRGRTLALEQRHHPARTGVEPLVASARRRSPRNGRSACAAPPHRPAPRPQNAASRRPAPDRGNRTSGTSASHTPAAPASIRRPDARRAAAPPRCGPAEQRQRAAATARQLSGAGVITKCPSGSRAPHAAISSSRCSASAAARRQRAATGADRCREQARQHARHRHRRHRDRDEVEHDAHRRHRAQQPRRHRRRRHRGTDRRRRRLPQPVRARRPPPPSARSAPRPTATAPTASRPGRTPRRDRAAGPRAP